MVIPEGEEKEKGRESVFKAIMAEKFSNLGGKMEIQIHEAPKFQNRLNSNRATVRHVIPKSLKAKDKE